MAEDGKIVPLDVKEGDRVIYSKYGGTEFVIEGEDLLILSERDVLAVGITAGPGRQGSHRAGPSDPTQWLAVGTRARLLIALFWAFHEAGKQIAKAVRQEVHVVISRRFSFIGFVFMEPKVHPAPIWAVDRQANNITKRVVGYREQIRRNPVAICRYMLHQIILPTVDRKEPV
jgi:hypothetical protein